MQRVELSIRQFPPSSFSLAFSSRSFPIIQPLRPRHICSDFLTFAFPSLLTWLIGWTSACACAFTDYRAPFPSSATGAVFRHQRAPLLSLWVRWGGGVGS